MAAFSPTYYPVFNVNLVTSEWLVKLECGDRSFNIPIETFALCENLRHMFLWTMSTNNKVGNIKVNPVDTIDMTPCEIEQFYYDLVAIHAGGEYKFTDDIYQKDIWNKIAYSLQYGIKLYLRSALAHVTQESFLKDPISLCFILNTLLVIEGVDRNESICQYNDHNSNTSDAILGDYINRVVRYICTHSIFPNVLEKLAPVPNEYYTNDIVCSIFNHNTPNVLRALNTIIPVGFLLRLLGLRRENGQIIRFSGAHPELTGLSECIITSYLDLLRLFYGADIEIPSTKQCRRISNASNYTCNVIPKGVGFLATPFVLGSLRLNIPHTREIKLVALSRIDGTLTIFSDFPDMNRYPLNIFTTVTVKSSQSTFKLSASWKYQINKTPEYVIHSSDEETKNFGELLLSTVIERFYSLEISYELLPLQSEV